jgi:dethiobiotin synthetase
VSVLVVSGTGTGVGKTVVTAALASHARLAGIDVAVCKPVQTGTACGDDDLFDVSRLSGVTRLYGRWRYPEPLAPAAAARRAGLALPSRSQLVSAVSDVTADLTIVEGAGGLLVPLGVDGSTLRDIAIDLAAPVLLVVAAGLGTLNHTALSLESLGCVGLMCAGLVIGSWPASPGVAELDNRDELARLAPVRAVLPGGAGSLSSAEFGSIAGSAFDPGWLAGLV